MNILILGSGGREHAFTLKLSQSPNVDQLFVAPGNAGTARIAQNIDIDPLDFEAVKDCVLTNSIRMVVVERMEPCWKEVKSTPKNSCINTEYLPQSMLLLRRKHY